MLFARRFVARSLLALVLLPMAASAAESVPALVEPAPAESAPPAWDLEPAERAEITRLLDAAVAHGFPDAAGATACEGELLITVPGLVGEEADTTTSRDPRTGRMVTRGMSVVGGVIHVFGFHLKLSDGRWLAGLTHVVPAAAADATRLTSVTTTELVRELRAPLGNQSPPTAADLARCARFPAAARPAVHAALRWRLLADGLGLWGEDELPLIALHLIRLAAPDSAAALVRGAAAQSRAQPADRAGPSPLLVTDADRQRYQRRRSERVTSRAQPGARQEAADQLQLILEPLPAVAARMLGAWFRAQLTDSRHVLPAAQARAGLLAVSGTVRQAETRRQADLLVARAALPEKLPADASFALRVALWEPPGRELAHTPEMTEERLNEATPLIRHQVAAFSADTMTRRDLGALIALVGDTGASRWLDHAASWSSQDQPEPRTVGENALRILAWLLAADPRVLLGRDPAEPWSPTAQADTAVTLQSWWRGHADQSLATALAQTLPDITDAGAAGRLVCAQPAAERAPLIAALVAQWHAHPPLAASPESLAEALVALDGESSVAEVVQALPVSGAQRVVLAAWHACHGEQRHLDQLLEEVLAAGGAPAVVADEPAAGQLIDAKVVLMLALRYPSEHRVARLLSAAAGPLTSTATCQVLDATFTAPVTADPVDVLLGAASCAVPGRADEALQMVLQLAALGDQRRLPPGMFKADGDHALLAVGIGELHVTLRTRGAAVVLPADVRVCDAMAVVGTGDHRGWGLGGAKDPLSDFDITQPLATREAKLVELRQLARDVAVKALEQAKLPCTLLPAVGLPAPHTDRMVSF